MRRRLVHVALGSTLLVVSLVVALAAVEIVLRGFYPLGGEPPIHEFDPVLGGRMRPNVDLVHVWDNHENVTSIRTNELGLRSHSLPAPKAPNELRILLLGDSYTFGYGVGDDDTFASLLERRLNERDDGSRRHVVVNAGVSSYGTAQALLQYEAVGRTFEADVVVLNFFVGNDLQDNLCLSLRSLRPTKVVPCFGLRDGRLVQVSRPEPPPKRTPPGGVLAPALAAWRELQVTKLVQQRATPLLMDNPHVLRLLSRLGIDVTPGYLPHVVAGWYVSPHADEGWAVTQALLARLAAEVRADGARFLVTIIPSRAQVLPAFASVLPVLYPGERAVADFLGDPAKPQRLLRTFLEARGVPTLDFTPVLTSEPDVSALYYPSIAHWSERGNAVAAEAIEAFLEEQGLLLDRASQ